jgi:hypothetical protein
LTGVCGHGFCNGAVDWKLPTVDRH